MSFARRCRSLYQHGPRTATPRVRPESALVSQPTTHPHRTFADSTKAPAAPKVAIPDAAAQATEEPPPPPQRPTRGSLGDSSIFTRTQPSPPRQPGTHTPTKAPPARNPTSMAPVLDPNPQARIRFEQKMVTREIQRRGRLTRAQELKRTERQYLERSVFHRTGMKKIAPLARQIAGKTVADALTQMEFSKKRAAGWIRAHLAGAAHRAMVERGMALGKDAGAQERWVRLKDGAGHVVRDLSSLYIDQAWVNKGPFGNRVVKRAKGKLEMQRRPSASISVLLKEEATRVREHEERVEKEKNKKVWVQLPNRAITSHKPYYAW